VRPDLGVLPKMGIRPVARPLLWRFDAGKEVTAADKSAGPGCEKTVAFRGNPNVPSWPSAKLLPKPTTLDSLLLGDEATPELN
jgi:hypothetical protein